MVKWFVQEIIWEKLTDSFLSLSKKMFRNQIYPIDLAYLKKIILMLEYLLTFSDFV